jgi:hypothetical protein
MVQINAWMYVEHMLRQVCLIGVYAGLLAMGRHKCRKPASSTMVCSSVYSRCRRRQSTSALSSRLGQRRPPRGWQAGARCGQELRLLQALIRQVRAQLG